MKNSKMLTIVALALMLCSVSTALGAVSLTVNGQDVTLIELELGRSCTVEVVSDNGISYVAYLGFDDGVVLGDFSHLETRPEAGNLATAIEYEQPTFYGYYLSASGLNPAPSAGVHFTFEYVALQFGKTELKLYDSAFTSVIDSVNITVIPLQPVAMGTAFTYQGRLSDTAGPADGLYDFRFKLYDNPDLVFAAQQGAAIDVNDLDVIDGYFTVELDFGSDVFDGSARWLEIAVQPGETNDPNAFMALSPRQEVTAAPYSLQTRGIFVDDAGNVGIGTTNPDKNLDIRHSNTGGGIEIDRSDVGIWSGLTYENDGDEKWFIGVRPDSDNLLLKNDIAGVSLVVEDVTGNVGIGTDTPCAKLDVETAFEQGGAATIGSSTNSATGDCAVAMGYNTTAGGGASTAMGNGTTAGGGSSTAMGNRTTAGGGSSTAMGYNTTANGFNSTSMGNGTTASAVNSTAMGTATTASGDSSTAMGHYTNASGGGSTAMGHRIEAAGNYSVAIGLDDTYRSVTQDNTMAIMGGNVGIGTTTPAKKLTIQTTRPRLALVENGGDAAVLEFHEQENQLRLQYWTDYGSTFHSNMMTLDGDTGNVGIGTETPGAKLDVETAFEQGGAATIGSGTNSATGDYAVAMGSDTTAIGGSSTAMGHDTTAGGDASTAMGRETTAGGYASTAMGIGTTAGGPYSTAMGYMTDASGNSSTAMGNGTTASGWFSTAMGIGTTASGNNSTAMGRGIEAEGSYSVAIALADMGGIQVTQNNTMAILGGNVGIGIANPGAYKLYVAGNAYSTGSWLGSDRRFKKNVETINSPIDKITNIKGVSFEWKSSEYQDHYFPEGRH